MWIATMPTPLAALWISNLLPLDETPEDRGIWDYQACGILVAFISGVRATNVASSCTPVAKTLCAPQLQTRI